MSGMRVEATLAPFFILHRAGGDDALPGADRAGAAEPRPGVAEDLPLDNEPLLAVGALDSARRPVAETRIHAMAPQVERFQHMAVGVDDVVGARPRQFPPGG
jgi:hypothetical protein